MQKFPFSRVMALSCFLLGLGHAASAQSPEGPQLPAPDIQIGHVHGEVRLGQYLVTHDFRYQGEYEAESNLFAVAGSPIYVFGDVDVEAIDDSGHEQFEPRRLVGTFEAGARRLFGVPLLSALVRHQSAHYIDIDNLYQGSWDMVALRWQ